MKHSLLTEQQKHEILKTWPDANLTNINEVIHFKHKRRHVLLIFEKANGSIWMIENCFSSYEESDSWNPWEIDRDTVVREIENFTRGEWE